MGQHKHNPTAIAAKEGKLPPKTPKKSKRQMDAELRMAVLQGLEKYSPGSLAVLTALNKHSYF